MNEDERSRILGILEQQLDVIELMLAEDFDDDDPEEEDVPTEEPTTQLRAVGGSTP